MFALTKRNLITLGVLVGLALTLFAFAQATTATSVFAQDTGSACEGVRLTGGDCDTGTGDGRTALENLVTTIVDILSIIVGALSVIMIIIGGLRYVTSAGDSSRVSSAKNTIIYALVGLIIVIFAQVIVNFVITESTNTEGTDADADAPSSYVLPSVG